MVHVLVQLPFVHPGMCTHLYDSGTWGLKAMQVTEIFWKLVKKKEMKLNILFLFSFSTSLAPGSLQRAWLADATYKTSAPGSAVGKNRQPMGRKPLGTCAVSRSGSAGSAAFSSIGQPEGNELTNQEKRKVSMALTGTPGKGPSQFLGMKSLLQKCCSVLSRRIIFLTKLDKPLFLTVLLHSLAEGKS